MLPTFLCCLLIFKSKLFLKLVFCSNKKIGKSVTLQVNHDVLKWFSASECTSETASVLSSLFYRENNSNQRKNS